MPRLARPSPQTLSAAIAIGQAVPGKRQSGGAPVERLLAELREQPLYGDARCAFEGKVVSVERDTRDGWVFKTCRMEALEASGVAAVTFQNENLSVTVDRELRCIVPDLITIVDTESAHASPTQRLAYGQRVSVIVCAAPSQLTSAKALSIVGPSGLVRLGSAHNFSE